MVNRACSIFNKLWRRSSWKIEPIFLCYESGKGLEVAIRSVFKSPFFELGLVFIVFGIVVFLYDFLLQLLSKYRFLANLLVPSPIWLLECIQASSFGILLFEFFISSSGFGSVFYSRIDEINIKQVTILVMIFHLLMIVQFAELVFGRQAHEIVLVPRSFLRSFGSCVH